MKTLASVVLVAATGLSFAGPPNATDRAAKKFERLHPIPTGEVRLLPGEFRRRLELNRRYVLSLSSQNLLQNFYQEAGVWNPMFRESRQTPANRGDNIHWGWESPTCQLRGHFLGHWLSAAAYLVASTGDMEAKAKADRIVGELARIQERNGGQWIGSIPQKYLFWIADGVDVWAPHYTLHKTFMGLIDMYLMTGNQQALDVAASFAAWFHEWTAQFSREQMDDILDVETGGMLEAFAGLFGITSDPIYRELIERYDRSRLFQPLLDGLDPLTNHHANTTIPEAHGAALAYEVTGERRWRDITEAYWESAVTERGYFCTGGQTSGEIWTPKFKFANRLGEKTQEHCTVYNMIRLADFLFRWTGDVAYPDYIERNIHNGILAQQNPRTGMIAYFLPLKPAARKVWGTPTNDFWCCHGSLVQAHTRHDRYIYYTDDAGVSVAQYIPSEARWVQSGVEIRLQQTLDRETSDYKYPTPRPIYEERPSHWAIDFEIKADQAVAAEIRLRLPWWVAGAVQLSINGEEQPVESQPSSWVTLKREWREDRVRLILPKKLTTVPIPDAPGLVAFLDGPEVLAGLTSEQRMLRGNVDDPATLLQPDNEREWAEWKPGYRTVGQDFSVRFIPLDKIVDETYTVYFPVEPRDE